MKEGKLLSTQRDLCLKVLHEVQRGHLAQRQGAVQTEAVGAMALRAGEGH